MRADVSVPLCMCAIVALLSVTASYTHMYRMLTCVCVHTGKENN